MCVVTWRRSAAAVAAGLEVIFLVVKERKAVHDIQRVSDIAPERQVKARQRIPETLIPAESRDVRCIKVPLRLQRHVADKVVEEHISADVTVKQIVPYLRVHSCSTQFQSRIPDTDDPGGLGCPDSHHKASESSGDKCGGRTPVKIRHTGRVIVSELKTRRHSGTATAVAVGLNQVVLNTQFHVRVGRVRTVDVNRQRIGRTSLQLVNGRSVEHIDALLSIPQHIVVANGHKYIALMAIQDVNPTAIIGCDAGIQQLQCGIKDGRHVLTTARNSTHLERVVTQKFKAVTRVVQNISIVDGDIHVGCHFISMLQITAFLECIHADVHAIATIAGHGGKVDLHHATTLIALVVQVVQVRAVVLSDHQAVAPVEIKRVARRNNATAEGCRNALAQLHTVFAVAVVGGIYRVQVEVHTAHSAIIRVRLVFNRYRSQSVLTVVAERAVHDGETAKCSSVITQARQSIPVHRHASKRALEHQRVEEVECIQRQTVTNVVVDRRIRGIEQHIDLLERPNTYSTGSSSRIRHTIIRMKSRTSGTVTVAFHRVAVELNVQPGIGQSIHSQPIMAVVLDEVVVDIEIQTVQCRVLREDVEAISRVVRRLVLFELDRVQAGILGSLEMEAVPAAVQERVVDHVQILDPRSLSHLEEQTVAGISQIINADDVVADHRTLQQRR